MKFDVISFDMFQTLVDINSRKYSVWQSILQGEYSREKAELFWKETLEYSNKNCKLIREGREGFCLMEESFTNIYNTIFMKYNIQFDGKEATKILFKEHNNAPLFPDAKIILQKLLAHNIIVTSDSDNKMIRPIIANLGDIKYYTSEAIRFYKMDFQNRFFLHILKDLNINPENILHIGDGTADILGAKNAGIKTCWINRDGKVWRDKIQPDFIITNMEQLMQIINID